MPQQATLGLPRVQSLERVTKLLAVVRCSIFTLVQLFEVRVFTGEVV